MVIIELLFGIYTQFKFDIISLTCFNSVLLHSFKWNRKFDIKVT